MLFGKYFCKKFLPYNQNNMAKKDMEIEVNTQVWKWKFSGKRKYFFLKLFNVREHELQWLLAAITCLGYA